MARRKRADVFPAKSRKPAGKSVETLIKKVLIATERERPDVAERREELKRGQPLLNPDRLVFVDETWANSSVRLTQRALVRTPCPARAYAQ